MKEDLAIARNSLMALQAENLALRQTKTNSVSTADSTNILDKFDPEMAEALADEKKKKHEVERELELQVKICDSVFIGLTGSKWYFFLSLDVTKS